MLDDYPKTKLVGLSLIVIVVTILVFIFVYENRIRDYLNKNWKEIRCNPIIMPLAGLADSVEGKDYMDKVTSNFNNCTSTVLQGTLGELMKPFLTLVGGIFSGLKKISNGLNSFREVLSSVRTLFQAFVGNITDKLSNSYAAMIYLREKMKTIIKRQVAIMEILNQFLTALPFLFYSLAKGPLPRFGLWLMQYIGILIAIIVICLLCATGGFFVSLFACPICALCFTENSIVGTGNYRKSINEIIIGDKLDDFTYVTGKILISGFNNNSLDVYRINNECALTGGHSVKIEDRWCRMNNLNIEPEKYKGNLICLITNNNTIPTDKYLFKDYLETNDEMIIYRQLDTIKNHLNYETNSPKHFNNIERTTTTQGFSYQTLKKIIENEDNIIFGFITIEDPDVEWYDYNGLILTANQLVYENNKWIRVYESAISKLIYDESIYIYNVISIDGILNIDGLQLRDFLETHNEDIQRELLRQLDNYHNK